MRYLLDTNTCIRYLSGRSQPVFERLNAIPESDIAVCSVVKFELRFGALRSQAVEKNLEEQAAFLNRYESLPFDDVVHVHAARIRADLANAGTPIGPYDILIAATALAHNLILVTHNTKEFGRIAGLKIEDWESED